MLKQLANQKKKALEEIAKLESGSQRRHLDVMEEDAECPSTDLSTYGVSTYGVPSNETSLSLEERNVFGGTYQIRLLGFRA